MGAGENMEKIIETKKDLLDYISERARCYSTICEDSVKRNQRHSVDQEQANAILVDFVNYIGANQGLDWGLKVEDLWNDQEEMNHPPRGTMLALEQLRKSDIIENYIVFYKCKLGSELMFDSVSMASPPINNHHDIYALKKRLKDILPISKKEVQITGLTKL
jgi:hypothetical protein